MTIQKIICDKIEYVSDSSRVTSYSTFGDPVLDIRYDRIILRDAYEYCIVKISDNKKYINLSVPKIGIITEISLITYIFKEHQSGIDVHMKNYMEGVPYFTFENIKTTGLIQYELNDCSIKFLKYQNALVIQFFECDLNNLYWIKTDNIYYGLEKNELKAVLYDVPENERSIYDKL